jgi:hypothetical protein
MLTVAAGREGSKGSEKNHGFTASISVQNLDRLEIRASARSPEQEFKRQRMDTTALRCANKEEVTTVFPRLCRCR